MTTETDALVRDELAEFLVTLFWDNQPDFAHKPPSWAKEWRERADKLIERYPALAASPTQPEAEEWGPYQYAAQLATHAAKKVGCVPEWKPLPDLMGALSQIDNCLSGLVVSPPRGEAQPAETWTKPEIEQDDGTVTLRAYSGKKAVSFTVLPGRVVWVETEMNGPSERRTYPLKSDWTLEKDTPLEAQPEQVAREALEAIAEATGSGCINAPAVARAALAKMGAQS